MMTAAMIESLEARRLFAGVTLMATGRLGGLNGWMTAMDNEITAKLGGPSQVPSYVLSITADPNTGNLTPAISRLAGTTSPQNNTSGEIIVFVDYSSVSANAIYPSTYVGSVVADFMMNTPVDGIRLASLPIHEVGVSRGTGIMDGVAKELGQAGVWVDQETYGDPDPIPAQGDPLSTIYDNVAFVDNYWRNDGSPTGINDGNPVDGAYNLNTFWLDGDSLGYGTPHLAPIGYYIGTIDLNATGSGEGPIYPDWYSNTPTKPARDATGFIYSDLVGAARPLSGVWAASGGAGARTATGPVGSQWGDVTDLKVAGGNSVNSGNSIQVNFLHEDRDSSDTVTFFLDTDRNPFNNAFAATLGSSTVGQAGAPTNGTATLSTAGVAPGAYWVCAKVTDAQGNTRYTYESITAPLTVKQGGPAPTATLTSAPSAVVTNSTPYQFTVTYNSSAGINAGTIGNNNWLVQMPNGSTEAAALISSGLSSGSTVAATYQVPAPTAIGTYTIKAGSSLVTDLTGNPIIGGTIGTFAATLPQNTVTGNVQLTTLAPVAGITIFADANNDGVLDNGELSAVTDSSGNYALSGLADGSYTIVEVLPSGQQAVSPTGGSESLSVASGQTFTGANFINSVAASAGATTTNLTGVFRNRFATSVKAGGTASASVRIINNGIGQISGFINVTLLLTLDGTPATSVGTLKTAHVKLNLKTGKFVTMPIGFKFPPGTSAGSYKIVAVVDSGNVIAESSKLDNVFSSTPITIKARSVSRH